MSVNVQTPSDKMQKKFDRFESWLIANGARFDQVGQTMCLSVNATSFHFVVFQF